MPTHTHTHSVKTNEEKKNDKNGQWIFASVRLLFSMITGQTSKNVVAVATINNTLLSIKNNPDSILLRLNRIDSAIIIVIFQKRIKCHMSNAHRMSKCWLLVRASG